MKPTKEEVGRRLTQLRLRNGYNSQKSLAEYIGTSRCNIHNCESGKNYPSYNLFYLLNEQGLSVKELL